MPRQPSFYWYDLETTGLDPARDRITQFAGQRTDYELNNVGEPFSTYIQLPPEVAPSPEAFVLTRLSPQHIAAGLSEWDAFDKIRELFMQPQTCVLGYNSIKFDDEFIRYGLYRHLFDPYEREWRSGNRRADLIDVVRMTAALRPDGMNWPLDEGKPTFSLEKLASANGVESEGAHDAMVDVRASIGVARKIRDAQPRLWQYSVENNKDRIGSFVAPLFKQAFLHSSVYYGNSRYCIAPVLAVAKHPDFDNRVVLVDLMGDLEVLIKGSPTEISQSLKSTDSGKSRVPLYVVALNRLPFFAPMNTHNDKNAERTGIDLGRVQDAVRTLQNIPDLELRVRQVYAERNEYPPSPFADEQLYDSFIPREDTEACRKIHKAIQTNLPWPDVSFKDKRLSSLTKILRAHLRSNELSEYEKLDYSSYVKAKLSVSDVGVTARLKKIEELTNQTVDSNSRTILAELKQYLLELKDRYGV